MINASTTLKNILYNNTNVTIDAGCYLEYNMNTMLDNISATNNISDATYTAQIKNAIGGAAWPSTRPNPYKKLFPVDAIIKPFRPVGNGIKYFILGGTDTAKNSFSSYRKVLYPPEQPRLYYPGVDTYYKYWVSPINTGANVTINYVTSGSKYALTNKIVLNFEKNHSLPSTYTIKIVKSDNTEVVIANALSTPENGKVILHYNGSTWSAAAPTEPLSFPDPVAIKSMTLTTPSAGAGKIIGVIELSARWIKDISSDIVSLQLNKEASSSSEDILPVGKVTANTLTMQLAKFDQTTLKYVTYNRESAAFDNTLTYMFKNVELKPFFKIYHNDGSITNNNLKYDKFYQGVFYIDSWDISTYGEVAITALDSAKNLMETVAPDILCENYPVTAILRRLLDSVGYTNYAFNLTSETDKSIPFVNYFWTDGTQTVWNIIQELCRDIQMNAFVDESGVLQFYSRDYIYGQTTKSWNFYESAEGSILPNIIDFTQKEIASANQVKVLWTTPVSSSYLGSSSSLWQSPTSFLVAGGLKYPLTPTSNTITLDLSTLDQYSKMQSGFNFNGYFLIDSEIIEFDAIGYQYVPREITNTTVVDALGQSVLNNGNNFINIWITTSSDVNKYVNLAKIPTGNIPSEVYFKPNGIYRVKTRGALGTTAAAHNASGTSTTGYSWTGTMVTANG